MNPITSSTISKIVAPLTMGILARTVRSARDRLKSPANIKSLERCVCGGVTGALQILTVHDDCTDDCVKTLFFNYFEDRDVRIELGALFRGRPVDRKELNYLFKEFRQQGEYLPNFRFETLISVFECTLLTLCLYEPSVARVIRPKQLLEKSTIDRQLFQEILQLAVMLHNSATATLTVEKGVVTAKRESDGSNLRHGFATVESEKDSPRPPTAVVQRDLPIRFALSPKHL